MARFGKSRWRGVALYLCFGLACSEDGEPGAEAGTGVDPGQGSSEAGDDTMGEADNGGEDGTSCELAAPAPLRRLSRHEYVASLRHVIGGSVVDEFAGLLAALPHDEPPEHGAFAREDQRLSDRHIESFYRVADAVAARIAGDRGLRAEVFGDCAADANDEGCVRAGLEVFMARAQRHPIEADAFEQTLAAVLELEGHERFHGAVFLVLMSPRFLYHVEDNGREMNRSSSAVLELDDYEVAARLSYHFWGEPPDDELWRAAATGLLSEETGYQAQVERLAGDERSRRVRHEYFEQWLHVHTGGFSQSPRLATLSDGLDIDGLAEEMENEVWAALDYAFERDHSWQEVLRSQQSFATGSRLAEIYGVNPWSGDGAPPSFPEGQRAGILTRAAMLQTQDGSTNPFRRGAFLRRAILCDEVAPPPADLPSDALETPDAQAGVSTREAFAAKVDDPVCAGCHQQFSALGYAMEAYDGLGRYRQVEQIVDDLGAHLGEAEIDTEVVPRIEAGDDRVTDGAPQLVERMLESGKSNHCFAEKYIRFTLGRATEVGDQCRVEALAHEVNGGLGLAKLWQKVALDPRFRRRAMTE